MLGTGNAKLINIRGTSGSGKSTLARRIKDHYTGQTRKYFEEGRKRPIGTVHEHADPNQRPLAMIGHYETPCGGTDTITDMDHIFELVRKSQAAGFDVLFEGLLISADFNRTFALHEQFGNQLLVVGLDVDLDTCLDSINSRRREAWTARCKRMEEQWKEKLQRHLTTKRGKEPLPPTYPDPPPPVPQKNTESKWKAVRHIMPKLEAAGVQTRFTSRDGAYRTICAHLGLETML